MPKTMYNLTIPRPKKDGGTWWQNVGVLFTDDSGKPTSAILNCIPVGDVQNAEGDVYPFDGRMLIFEKDNDGGNRGGGRKASSKPAGRKSFRNDDLDDEIPF